MQERIQWIINLLAKGLNMKSGWDFETHCLFAGSLLNCDRTKENSKKRKKAKKDKRKSWET